jgi:uncharacterized membrane protein
MSEPVSSPLTDNAAGAIAYITFLPAIVFLVLDPYNKSSYVRFHAWQSIFLSILAFVLYFALTIIAAISLFFAPFLLAMLNLLIFLACFFVWIVCVVQAVNGKRFQLPIIGAFAEKLAGA